MELTERDRLAMMFMIAECEDDIDSTIKSKETIAYWTDIAMPRYKKALSEPHCGDCTSMPFACFRCQAEEYYGKADKILELTK